MSIYHTSVISAEHSIFVCTVSIKSTVQKNFLNFLLSVPDFQNLKALKSYVYSRLSIKCVGWNKHVGWKFFEDQIKVLDGISMLVGKCLDNH